MNMSRILIAEDEEAIRELIAVNLTKAGFDVVKTCDGQQAIDTFSADGGFDAVLLDIMMPNMDGVEVCRQIRKTDSTVGIIMLTAKSQDSDKVDALMTGADDYVTKPFSPTELIARVSTVCRRVALLKNSQNIIATAGPDSDKSEFTLNLRRRTLSKKGKELELTPVEFQMIEILFDAKGDSVDRDAFLHKIWGETFLGEDKIVDVNIRRLRMKIEDDPGEPRHILTVRGIGYRWKD